MAVRELTGEFMQLRNEFHRRRRMLGSSSPTDELSVTLVRSCSSFRPVCLVPLIMNQV